MKYVKTYENYKKYRNSEIVNEELFGLGKLLLGLFKKLGERISKMLGDNPNITNIDELIEKVYFNPADKDYIFKITLDEFKKRTDANNEDCFKLIDDVLNAIAPENQQVIYDELLKKFGKNIAPIEIIKYYLSVARNRAIKDYKYAGGPDAKPGETVKIDPKLKKLELTDTTHLPEFKKLLTSTGEDRKKKKEVAINWVEKTLIPKMLQYIQAITEDQIREYLKTKGLTISEGGPEDGYKIGDTVIYKREKFNQDEWGKLTDEEKKDIENPKMKELQKEQIGIKVITKIDDKNVTFKSNDGTKEIIKPLDSILMKLEVKAEGQDDLVKKLGDLKAKNPDDVQKVSKVVDVIAGDDEDKKKQLNDIIGGEAQGGA
jgi:hypothetical protein